MRFLVVLFGSVLALASGSYAQHYMGPIHIPVIDANGVPVEPHEVQAARASHLAAHAAIRSSPSFRPEYDSGSGSSHFPSFHSSSSSWRDEPRNPWPGPYAEVAPDGTPLDTEEVKVARHQHFTDYNEAAKRNGNGNVPWGGNSPYGYVHKRKRRSIYGGGSYPLAYQTSQAFPVIGHDGQPQETPEVQDAKARHFAAHSREAARNRAGGPDFSSHTYSPSFSAATFSAPFSASTFAAPMHAPMHAPMANPFAASPFAAASFASPFTAHGSFPMPSAGYGHGFHYPVIGPSGVPLEPPEVQQARAMHLAAHARTG